MKPARPSTRCLWTLGASRSPRSGITNPVIWLRRYSIPRNVLPPNSSVGLLPAELHQWHFYHCRWARALRHALDHSGINPQSCPRDGLEVKLIAGYFDEHE
jgi:hypothetical protein